MVQAASIKCAKRCFQQDNDDAAQSCAQQLCKGLLLEQAGWNKPCNV